MKPEDSSLPRCQIAAVLLGCVLLSGCSQSNDESTSAQNTPAPPVEGVSATHEPAEAEPPTEGLIRTEHGWYNPRTHELTPFDNAPAAPASQPNDWRSAEADILTDYVQLTDPAMFSRAGEAYFDPGMNWIIYQASPRAEKKTDGDAPYSMYVAKLIKETGADGIERITGSEPPILVSAPGSHNTCGFFNPAEPWRIIFGSTIIEPTEPERTGYQREGSRYSWAFPAEMEITTRVVQEIFDSYRAKPKLTTELDFLPSQYTAKPLWARPEGYDAECAYSPDGRWIVFGSIEPGEKDADLWIANVETGYAIKVIDQPGYDGGPFFSPDGRRICYRSDRKQNELLQIFVADLAFDARGAITGIAREHQLTDNDHVNWAPYWHPSGKFLIYTTSEMGHDNYEVFSIEVPSPGAASDAALSMPTKRLTNAAGFDGLPVFSSDGSYMMWTSQRGMRFADDDKPSSQVWVARTHNLAP